MPEQITRRSSIKIYESPLHRGSQHGSPAFRKKKLLRNNSKASDMSDLEISPPPRCKRISSHRKIEDVSHVLVKRSPNSADVVKLPPKTKQSVSISHYNAIGNNSNRLPPPHPHLMTNNISAPPSKTVRNNYKNGEEHIYESLVLAKRASPENLRLSADVQCWPFPKNKSLPPPPPPPKNSVLSSPPISPNKSLGKSIQSSLRSVSLGRGVEPISRGSRTLLQRLQGLRRSFNSREKMHPGSVPRRADDPDWVFFRGFGSKKREDVEPYVVNHGPLLKVANCVETPKAPPRRKRPQRMLMDKEMQQPLRRSLSFTDAHFIAQAVYEGDTKLIEELYPDFPRSEPIYAVVDKKTKKQQVLSPVEELAGSSNSSERSPQKSPAQIQNHQRTNLQTAKDVKDVEDNPLQKEVTVASSSVMFVNSSPKNVVLPDVVNDSDVTTNEPQQNWNNSSNSILIECNSNSSKSKTWQSNVHPFAHRTQQRYAFAKKKAPPSSKIEDESLEDSFEKIIKSADHSLHQAESILSSLRQRSKTLPAHATPPKPQNDEDEDGLGSDIEANIRKLEKTQAKINAALEAFRSIKAEEEPSKKANTMASVSRPLTLVRTSSNSCTAPAKMRQQASFNNSDSSAASSKNYEADIEECDNNMVKDGSWSDSESGFLHPPIKSKLKGLLGTWGRNRSRQIRQNHQHKALAPSISDPVPILQPPTATVSEYARRIEILASDLANGSAIENSNRSSPSSSGTGYYTPNANSKKSPESSQRSSVSSAESEEISDSEDQISAPSLTSVENGVANEQNNKAFYIANELMTSERVYVDVLRLLNVDFRDYLQKARRESKSGLMPDSDYSRLFNNLPELQTLNEDLLQDFESRIANWSSHPKIADVIVKKGPFLKLYTTYIREFSAVNYHFEDCCGKYPKFCKLVKDFEKRDCCRNLKLQHFMLKPVQRLPQYKLLLEDYLRHLPHDSQDFDDTTIALRIVSDAADHANNTIRQGDKFRRMLQLQSRLGDYFELIRPGRDLIKEGELQKVSRKGVGPRYFILLSDCLLYTSYSGSWSGSDTTSLRVSYQIPLSTLNVKLPPDCNSNEPEVATELHLTSTVRSFCVRANSIRERNAWLDALNTAIEDHNSRKATFFCNDQRTECKMGMAPPIWVPDRRVSMCQKCAIEFTVLVRRHHCRACGQVVCSNCSANKAPLRYLEFDAARVCDLCYETLEKELGNVEGLRGKFKKRDVPSSSSARSSKNTQQRLKNGEGAQMSGYLRKKQKNGAKWKRLWFVLKDRTLHAYKAPEDALPCDTLPILGFKLETLSEKNIQLYEGESGGLVFQLAHPRCETLIFCADNDNICEKWMAAINEATS